MALGVRVPSNELEVVEEPEVVYESEAVEPLGLGPCGGGVRDDQKHVK